MATRSFYVPPEGAPDATVVDIRAEVTRVAVDAVVRAPLMGSPEMRVVVHRWPSGHATVPHHHPRGREIFMVLEGRAAFRIGDDVEHEVGPGVLLCAAPGVRHAVRVVGHTPLLLFTAVAPNEDRADETIE